MFDLKPQTTAKSRNLSSPKRLIEKITSRNCSSRTPFLSPYEDYAWTKPEALEIAGRRRGARKGRQIRIEGRGTRTTVPGMRVAGDAKSEATETATESEVYGEEVLFARDRVGERDRLVVPMSYGIAFGHKKLKPLACLARWPDKCYVYRHLTNFPTHLPTFVNQ